MVAYLRPTNDCIMLFFGLLVFVDYFSRWVELFPMRTAIARTIATILRTEILTRYGVPDFILSDRGTQFVSSIFKELSFVLPLTQPFKKALACPLQSSS